MPTKKPKRTTSVSNTIRLSLFWAIVILAALAMWAFFSPHQPLKDVPISQVIKDANEGKLAKIEGRGNDLKITVKDQDKPTQASYINGGVGTLLREGTLNNKGRAVISDSAPSDNTIMWNILTFVTPVVLIGILFMFMMRQAQG